MIGPFTMSLAGEQWKGASIAVGTYGAGAGLALCVVNDEGPICDVTVNLAAQGVWAEPGCVLVKDYGENTGLLAEMARLGYLEPTGRTFRVGLAEVAEARLVGPLAGAAEPAC